MTATLRRFSLPGPVPACAATLGLGLGQAFGLAACSTVGDRFQTASVNAVTNGMTRTEVVGLMDAQPFFVSPDGRRLDFGYTELVGPNSYRHRVTFLLDADGRVVGVPPGGILGPNGKKYADLVGPQG